MSDTLLKTRYGERVIPTGHIDAILDTRIIRIVGDDDWLIGSGFYSRCFLVWHAEQEQYHMFASPYDALRGCLRAKAWEGVEPTVLAPGDKQRLVEFLGRHRYLQLLLGHDKNAVGRKLYDEVSAELALVMGEPRNKIKQQILDLTLRAGDPEERQAPDILNEAMKLDEARLKQIEAIGEQLNWRAALIAEVIVQQQQLMSDVGQELSNLAKRHAQNLSGSELLWLANEAEETLGLLRGAKDRPFRALARQDRIDVLAFLRHHKEGNKPEAKRDLERAVVAHRHFGLARQVQVILYRIALGQCRGARYEVAYNELSALHDRIVPQEGAVLRNNPLYRLKGLINDALYIMRSPQRDWSEIQTLLRQATACFG